MSRHQVKLLEHLPVNRLPTSLQVLQRYEFFRKSNPTEKASVIYDILIKEMVSIWNKAYIPIMKEQNIKRKLEKLRKKYVHSKKQHYNLMVFDVLFDIKSESGKFRNRRR